MSTDASPHNQVRHVLSPTTTELVIDGAVYSVDGIKQLIGRELTRTHLINGNTYTTETLQRALDVYYNSGNKSGPPADASPADAAKLDVDPSLETTRDRIFREISEKDTAAKEEILTAFVAKYGAEPDEVEVVQNGMHWQVRKKDGYADRAEARRDRKLLINFFRVPIGELMGIRGDSEGWSPGETAVFFLKEYAKLHSPTREQLAERVREDLHALQMHQVVPVVTAYLALDDALRSLKGPTVSVDGLPKTARGDDEPDR